ncbi:MAG: hypothetical protein HKN16_00270 [Saprospiraceae bacterium]|nr:hypothetical protein [Saprospiraceae bacterium]
MNKIHQKFGYIMDPHGAVGYLAWKAFEEQNPDHSGIILETAHPAKFLEEVEKTLEISLDIPERLEELSERKKEAELMPASFDQLKDYLLARF